MLKTYQHYYYFPRKSEKIIVNEAICKKCDDRVKSVASNVFTSCNCENIGVKGSNQYIIHRWKNTEMYMNAVIIYLKGE
jgi:hypothetical protein